MGIGVYPVYSVDKDGKIHDCRIEIRYPDGTLAIDIGFHETEATDGAVRAQFELRSADIPMSCITDGTRLDFARHAFGRSGIVVSLDPPERFAPAMRFCIDIPGQASAASYSTQYGEASTSGVNGQRSSVQKVRTRHGNPLAGDNTLRDMVANLGMRKLANDGSKPKLVSLPSQSDDAPNPGT